MKLAIQRMFSPGSKPGHRARLCAVLFMSVLMARFALLLMLGASFSDYAELKIIDHVNGKTSFTMPATVAMALTTVVPTDASTGASITEATYTGYARKAIAAGDWNAAAAGNATNANAIIFAACTAGASTIIGFAICDSSTIGAGNILYWGTVTSKVIDTSNTPPTVAIGGLSISVD